jgi:hypothetical protein
MIQQAMVDELALDVVVDLVAALDVLDGQQLPRRLPLGVALTPGGCQIGLYTDHWLSSTARVLTTAI